MSVLFKALQKAEKENEQRQTTSGAAGFDPGRLAGSGAIKLAGGRGINWRTAGMVAAFVLAVAIMAAFFLVQPAATPPSRQIAAVPAPVSPGTPGNTEVIPVMQPPAASAPGAAAPPAQTAEVATPVPLPAASASESAASAASVDTPPAQAASAPVATESVVAPSAPVDVPASSPVTPAAATKTVKASSPATPAQPQRKPGMPEIAVDSPARMLNPPIAIQRAEFDLAGVGDAVRVREVSQKAQDDVGAGYSALVSGAYDMAIGFYDRALKAEPNSVMALLGRAAALQKMRKLDEAQAAYNRVLKLDPNNREALSNLTVIISDSSPGEAVTKLLDLEKEYPTFSPLKAQLGLAYAKQGLMDAALDYLRRAAALSPESVMYQYNTALVLDHLNRSDQAIAAYERVLTGLESGRGAPEISSSDIERRVRYLRTR